MTSLRDFSVNAMPKTENRGKRVKARSATGEILDRLVWEEVEDAVFICTERCFTLLQSGDDSFRAVGFERGAIEWVTP